MRTRFWLAMLAMSSALWLGGIASAQQWSGIIDPSRAIDWSKAGVSGGVPNRTTICSTFNPGATAAQINSAIASCASGGVVYLSRGTYNLSNGIQFNGKSNVTLRGAGADQTLLVFSGGGAGFYNSLVSLEPGSLNEISSEQNVCDWTAGYSKGATTITLANCGSTTPTRGSLSNLKVGNPIILDQVDETADTGQIWNCATMGVCAGTIQGGGARTNGPSVNGTSLRSQQQMVKVASCDGNSTPGHVCTSGTNITITPGLYMPNWQSRQAPQAWFATSPITGDGVEDLSIDNTSNPGNYNLHVGNCTGCWISGVRSVAANRSHVSVGLVSHMTIQNNYIYRNQSGGSVSYGVELMGGWDSLVVNNIFQQTTDSSPSCSGACQGNVFAYNFATNTVYSSSPGWFIASFVQHASGDALNLWEGNIGPSYNADQVHGTHHFETMFRNRLTGWQSDCSGSPCSGYTIPAVLTAGSRYFNVIGNVLGYADFHQYYQCRTGSESCPNWQRVIYNLQTTGAYTITGFCLDPACTSRGNYDPQVTTYLMRWGNYDTVNNTARWESSEVPGGISPYGNAIPSSRTLPASFYYSSKPSWWPSGKAWPPIGPDVTGGNIPNVAGHAYTIPAQDCYINVMRGPVDGSASILNFNATSCYGSATQLSPPTNLRIVR